MRKTASTSTDTTGTEKFTSLSPKQVMKKIKQARSSQIKLNKAQKLLAEAKMACDVSLKLTRPIPYKEWLNVSLTLCTALDQQSNIEETQALATTCSEFLEKNTTHLEAKDVETYRKRIQAILDQCNKKLKPIAPEIKYTSFVTTLPPMLKEEISILLDNVQEKFTDLNSQSLLENFTESSPEGSRSIKITSDEFLKKSRGQMLIWAANPKNVEISPIIDYFLLFITIFNSTNSPSNHDLLLNVIAACQKIFLYFKEKSDKSRLDKIRVYAFNSEVRLSRGAIDEKALHPALTDFLKLDYNWAEKNSIPEIIEFTMLIARLSIMNFNKIEQQKNMMDTIYQLIHKALLTFKKSPPDAKNYPSDKFIPDVFFIMNKCLGIQMPLLNFTTLIDETKEIVKLFLPTKTIDDQIPAMPILKTLIRLIQDNYLQLQSETYQSIFSTLVGIGLIFTSIPNPGPEEKFCLIALTELKSHIGKKPREFSDLKVETTLPEIAFKKFLELKSESLRLMKKIDDELKLTDNYKRNSPDNILAEKMYTAEIALRQPLDPAKYPATIKPQASALVEFLVDAANLYRSISVPTSTTFYTITTILDFTEEIIPLFIQHEFFLRKQGICNYIRLHAYLLCHELFCKEEVNKLLDKILSTHPHDLYFLHNEIFLIDSSINLCSEKFFNIKNSSLLAKLDKLSKKMIAIFANLPLISYFNIEQHKYLYALTVKNNLTMAGLYLNFEEEKEKNSELASSTINRTNKFIAARKSITLTEKSCLMVLNTIVKIFTNDFSLSERLKTTAQQQLFEIARVFTPPGEPEGRIKTSLETIQLLQYHLQPKQPDVTPEPDAKLQTAPETKNQETQELKELLSQQSKALTKAKKKLKHLEEKMNKKIKENERIEQDRETQARLHQEATEKLKSQLKQSASEREKQDIRIKELEEKLALQDQMLKSTQSEYDKARAAIQESLTYVHLVRDKAVAAVSKQNQTIGALVDQLEQSEEECYTLKESLKEAKTASEKPGDSLTKKEEELSKTKAQPATQPGWRLAFPYTSATGPTPLSHGMRSDTPKR